MNCALAVRMLDAYIDDELDAATAAEISEHVASCPACAQLHGQRVAMQSALRSALPRYDAPVGLLTSVRARIEQSVRQQRPGRSPPWWQAVSLAGVTALFGVWGGWWLAQPIAPGTLQELAVERHVDSLRPAGPRIDVASSDRHVVRPWFQGRLEFAPTVRDLAAQGFELVGARVDHIADRQAVAVVYRLHSHVISVYSWRGHGDQFEGDREATIRGFNVATWSVGDLNFAAVSDTDNSELRRFVAAFQAHPQ